MDHDSKLSNLLLSMFSKSESNRALEDEEGSGRGLLLNLLRRSAWKHEPPIEVLAKCMPLKQICAVTDACLSKQSVKSRFSSECVNRFQEVHKPIPKHRLQQKMKNRKQNTSQNDSFTNSEKTLLDCKRFVHIKQLSQSCQG